MLARIRKRDRLFTFSAVFVFYCFHFIFLVCCFLFSFFYFLFPLFFICVLSSFPSPYSLLNVAPLPSFNLSFYLFLS